MPIQLKSAYNKNFYQFEPTNSHRPLLLYLPGMDGSGRLLQAQVNNLQPIFDIRCLSIPTNDLSNWDVLTTRTIEQIDAQLKGTNHRQIYLCGESFGGCLAIKIAVTAPSLVEKLILVNPASSFNKQPLLGWGISLTRWIPYWLYSGSAVGLLPFLAELSRITPKDRRDLLQAMKSLPQEVVSWRLSLLQQFNVPPTELQKFASPTLIIASKSDRLLPSVEEAKSLVELFPNSAMEVLPSSGHACLLEKETNLASILIKHNLIQNKG